LRSAHPIIRVTAVAVASATITLEPKIPARMP
jgi:hypothetical protein